MRKKFRLWDYGKKEMIIQNEVDSFHRFYLTPFGDVYKEGKLQNVEVLQWTGLLDKSGVEIYEGDIVTINMGGPIPSVLELQWGGHWKYAGFGLHGKREKNNYGPKYSWDPLNPETAKACEIIGNIYENKELLN